MRDAWPYVAFVVGLAFSLSVVYYRMKAHLAVDIRNLLEDCRGTESWDDRSELKLGPWVEGDERELHRKSLVALYRIRRQVREYYDVHLKMDMGVTDWDKV